MKKKLMVTLSGKGRAVKNFGHKTGKKLPPTIKTAPLTEKVSTAVVVASIEKQAEPIFRKLTAMSIKDKDGYELAADQIKTLKTLAREAKRQEEDITGPLKDVIKKTQALFKPFQEKVIEAEEMVKGEMLQFLYRQKIVAAKLGERFEAGEIKKVSTLVTKQNELRVDNGTAQVRKVWTLFIDDPNVIPREYLVPNIVAIKEELKAGGTVKGCRWEQADSIAI